MKASSPVQFSTNYLDFFWLIFLKRCTASNARNYSHTISSQNSFCLHYTTEHTETALRNSGHPGRPR